VLAPTSCSPHHAARQWVGVGRVPGLLMVKGLPPPPNGCIALWRASCLCNLTLGATGAARPRDHRAPRHSGKRRGGDRLLFRVSPPSCPLPRRLALAAQAHAACRGLLWCWRSCFLVVAWDRGQAEQGGRASSDCFSSTHPYIRVRSGSPTRPPPSSCPRDAAAKRCCL